MEATRTQLLSSAARFLLLFILFFWRCPLFSFGQLINTTPLPDSNIPYTKDAPPSLTMHNLTSQSVVLFGRPLEPAYQRPNATTGFATGFFIITDPNLDHYCFLTAAHALFDSDDVNKSDVQMELNMAFRVTYENARANPATYRAVSGAPSGIPVSVTVAAAQYKGGIGVKDGIDYAIVKVPKFPLIGIPIVQHGIEFLDDKDKGLPKDRLDNDPMKSVYVVHHAINRPQQISTLKKTDFITPAVVNDPDAHKKPPVYLNMYVMPNWKGLDFGSSGAPLVLPMAGQQLYAPAIGIVAKKGEVRRLVSPPQQDHAFQKLSTIKLLLFQHCLGKLKESEIKQSVTPKLTLGERSKVEDGIADNFIKVLKDLSEKLSGLPTKIIVVSGNVAKTIQRIQTCMSLLKKLKETFKANAELPKVLVEIDKLDTEITNLERELDNITLTTAPTAPPTAFSELTTNFRDGMYSVGEGVLYLGSLGSYSIDDLDHTLQFKSGETIDKSISSSIQIISTKINSLMEAMRFTAGLNTSIARRKRDYSDESKQMGAPLEQINLRKKIIEGAQFVNQNLSLIPKYERKDMLFFKGVEFYYNDQDGYSNRYLLDTYYENEYRITEIIIKEMSSQIKAVKEKGGTYVNPKQFETKCLEKIKAIQEALGALEDKDFPRGFINLSNYGKLHPEFDLKYHFFLYPSLSDEIAKYPQPQSWKNLSITFNAELPSYGYKPMDYPSTIRGSVISGLTQNNLWVANGYWYSTQLRLTGSFALEKITHFYDAAFKTYLDQNSISINRKGILRSALNKKPISYDQVFDKQKLPPHGVSRDFVTGFKRSDYSKTKTETVVYAKDTINYAEGTIKYELETPELLVLARGIKLVKTNPHGSSSGEIKFKTEIDIVDGIEDLGETFRPMEEWANKWLSLEYRIELGNNFGWTYKFPFIASATSTKPRRLAATKSTQTISAEDNALPTLHPNPVSDHLKLNLPEGYGKCEISILTTTGAKLNLPVQNQGSGRLIDVRQLQPGMYFIQVQAEGKSRHTLKFLKQ